MFSRHSEAHQEPHEIAQRWISLWKSPDNDFGPNQPTKTTEQRLPQNHPSTEAPLTQRNYEVVIVCCF